MEQNILKKLEQQILDLVDAYQSLRIANDKLHQQQAMLIQERDHLLEKNKTATKEIKQLIQVTRAAKSNHRK